MQAFDTGIDVLIAGAGPTGLALAAELTRRGTKPLLIDRQPAGANTSRACVIHARTLEVLEPIGTTRDLLTQGLQVPHFHIRDCDRTLITIDFSEIPSAYPFTLMCPQDRVERCLLRTLEGLGGTVVRPCELVRFEALESHVEAQLRSDNATQTIKARWLIGCDGMHSTVRSLAKRLRRGRRAFFTKVSQIDMLAGTDPPSDRLTDRSCPNDNIDVGHLTSPFSI
jgi:2-polyprenyl-6-methoxyphenol hydroxylase-like FAD-dependent oxidoreductase